MQSPSTVQSPSDMAQPPTPPVPPEENGAEDEFQFGAFLAADPGTALAGVPAMFGDSFFRGPDLTLTSAPDAAITLVLTSEMPLAAATRRVLVAEHNKALPVDRVYFNYNHFHNALTASATATATGAAPETVVRDFSVDQYTLGWEKTFGCGCWSTELRLPVAGRYDFDFVSLAGTETASITGGELGNLAVLFKRVLYIDCTTVVSAGFGFDLPTGDDARAVATTTAFPATTTFQLNNETVYFLPYVAAMGEPDCQRFWHTFVQLDVPLNPDSYRFQTTTPTPTVISGDWDDQTLLHLDVGGGYWLYRDECCCTSTVTGVAAIAEIHYTTALDDTDIEAGGSSPAVPRAGFDLRNAANRVDVINLTTGLHVELSRCRTLRVAADVPLREGDNRWFDAEIMAQFARRF